MIYKKDNDRYNLCFFLATYVLPTIGMGLCYAQMGLHLYRGDKTILQLVLIPPAALNKSRKDKKRIVTMFAVVVTIFIVCWAPYHVYFLLVYHLPSITQYQHIGNSIFKTRNILWQFDISDIITCHDIKKLMTQCSGHVYLCFYWLAMSNSCVNPIIVRSILFRFYILISMELSTTGWTRDLERISTKYSFSYRLLWEGQWDLSRKESGSVGGEKTEHLQVPADRVTIWGCWSSLNFSVSETLPGLSCKDHTASHSYPILLRAVDLNTERMTRATNTEKWEIQPGWEWMIAMNDRFCFRVDYISSDRCLVSLDYYIPYSPEVLFWVELSKTRYPASPRYK